MFKCNLDYTTTVKYQSKFKVNSVGHIFQSEVDVSMHLTNFPTVFFFLLFKNISVSKY